MGFAKKIARELLNDGLPAAGRLARFRAAYGGGYAAYN